MGSMLLLRLVPGPAQFPILAAMRMAAPAGSLRLMLDLLHHRRYRVAPCNQIWDLAHTDSVRAAGRFHMQQELGGEVTEEQLMSGRKGRRGAQALF